jgi:hypothetical protein
LFSTPSYHDGGISTTSECNSAGTAEIANKIN